jgi:hypothetical protein
MLQQVLRLQQQVRGVGCGGNAAQRGSMGRTCSCRVSAASGGVTRAAAAASSRRTHAMKPVNRCPRPSAAAAAASV